MSTYCTVVVNRMYFLGGVSVAMLARHGAGHTLAPAEVNYRANIAALKDSIHKVHRSL
jgi:purine nucleoside phosphorylase